MKNEGLNYYDEFIKNAEIALEMARILKEYTASFDYQKSIEIEEKVHKLENDADKNLHRTLNFLIKDFLPPFEREDIVMLANKMDDTIDEIDEIVIDLDILNVTTLRQDFPDFIELIYQTSLKLKDMMSSFKTAKKYEDVKSLIVDINAMEESGDRLYASAIRKLYQTEQNAIEISKWHTIYNNLESCVDMCEDIANCVDEILLKNS